MTITVALLITIVVLFSVTLLVLVAYLGPIFNEIKLILRDTRNITHTVSERVEKVDSLIDKASGAMGFMNKAAKVADTVSSFKKKKRRKKRRDEGYEDEE